MEQPRPDGFVYIAMYTPAPAPASAAPTPWTTHELLWCTTTADRAGAAGITPGHRDHHLNACQTRLVGRRAHDNIYVLLHRRRSRLAWRPGQGHGQLPVAMYSRTSLTYYYDYGQARYGLFDFALSRLALASTRALSKAFRRSPPLCSPKRPPTFLGGAFSMPPFFCRAWAPSLVCTAWPVTALGVLEHAGAAVSSRPLLDPTTDRLGLWSPCLGTYNYGPLSYPEYTPSISCETHGLGPHQTRPRQGPSSESMYLFFDHKWMSYE